MREKIVQYGYALAYHPRLLLEILQSRSIDKLRNEYFRLEAQHSLSKEERQFRFNGKVYDYFYNEYSFTWATERTVEIPIVSDVVKKYQGKQILEIGNVLSHHLPTNHLVVDKYEIAPNVVNEDVISFHSNEKFDLIFSISTIEHVGWDEMPKDETKISRAIANLRSLLAPDGELWITLPLGYNKYLGRMLNERALDFDFQYFMKRITRNNVWIQCNWEDVKAAKYGRPFNNANAIMFGVIEGRS